MWRTGLTLSAPMGTKRGQGRGSFVSSVLDLVDDFYRSVVQGLRPWAAVPPKLRPAEPGVSLAEEGVAPSLVSTSLSSQDGAEAVEAPPATASDDAESVSEAADSRAEEGRAVGDVADSHSGRLS